MAKIPASLSSAVRDGCVVPFVGSGVSLSVKRGLFPTWPELLESMATRLASEAKQSEKNIVSEMLTTNRLFDAAN